jgi:hypothetical protein
MGFEHNGSGSLREWEMREIGEAAHGGSGFRTGKKEYSKSIQFLESEGRTRENGGLIY